MKLDVVFAAQFLCICISFSSNIEGKHVQSDTTTENGSTKLAEDKSNDDTKNEAMVEVDLLVSVDDAQSTTSVDDGQKQDSSFTDYSLTTPVIPERKYISTQSMNAEVITTGAYVKEILTVAQTTPINIENSSRPMNDTEENFDTVLRIIAFEPISLNFSLEPVKTRYKLRPTIQNSNTSLEPIICGLNQRYLECGRCEPSCFDPFPNCEGQCLRGCFCESGLVRAPGGSCVELNKCPAAELSLGGMRDSSVEDCGSNEEYLSCGWCEPTCTDLHPHCPQPMCTRGCLCRPPLVRHHGGACVDPVECKPKKCSSPGETYVCLYGCEARCDRRVCLRRPRGCVVGCYCRPGLLRDRNGTCVAPDQCKSQPLRKSVP